MLENMSSSQFRRWRVYEAYEPFGDRLVASTLVNVFSKAGADFIWPWDYLSGLKIPEDPAIAIKRMVVVLNITKKAQEILEQRRAKRKVARLAERQAKQKAIKEQIANSRAARHGKRNNAKRREVQKGPRKG